MTRLFCGLVLLTLSLGGYASGAGSVNLGEPEVDIFELSAVQRGAAHFVDYCITCHSIKHLRYSRLGADLQLTEADLRKDILPDGIKLQDSLTTALRSEDSEAWFGVAPPDLSLVARSRGPKWLFSYLKGFYLDNTRPLGVNNVVFDGVGMPNVLWELQGLQKPVFKKHGGAETLDHLQQVQPGKLSAKEFDTFVNELVTFLVYAAEPAQYERLKLGKYVLFGLLILAVLFYKLKKEYWRDIH